MVAWDADPDFDEQAGEQWLILLPKKWNLPTHKQVYSWRYDPRELGATAAPERGERRARMQRVVRVRDPKTVDACTCVKVGPMVWGHA